MHPKLLKIDKVKELQKDKLMKSLSNVNYIKIVEKDYTEFFNLLESLSTEVSKSEIATESGIKFEKFDEDFNKNEKRRLSEFKSGKLDKFIIDAYKSNCPSLTHVRYNQNTTGEIFIDKNDVVGYYQTEKKDNCIWLQAFEICKKYRGSSLGSQLFSRAIRAGKITNLSVDISNEVAINLYRSYGFIEYTRDKKMMFMMKS